MSAILSAYCLLSNMQGPPTMVFQNMTFQLWPVDRVNCPPVDPNRDVIFHLYTDLNPHVSQILKTDDDHLLESSHMDFNKPTVIFFHGWMESHRSDDADSIRLAYLKRGGYNIILTQAERLLAGPDYIHAAANVKPIGKFAASFIDYLVTKGLNLDKLHVIGFSLGGQIVGFMGKSVRSGKLTRITAIEPAAPLFSSVKPSDRIAPEDAEFVDVIHSNSYIFGLKYSVGHADFYPNGGGPRQPGCSLIDIFWRRGFATNWFIFCDHYRAYQLYSASVNDPGAFPAKKCLDRKHYKHGMCKDETNYIGIAANPKHTGDYYLNTGLAAVNI